MASVARGGMFNIEDCPACGRLVSAVSRFCRFCGARVGRPPADAALVCGGCAAPNRPDAAYCAACGDKLIM